VLEGNEGSEACSKGNEGSRAHLKEGRIENALPLMVKGSKAHSKRNEVRARRRTQVEVG
jgi:hypothetical protein